VISNYILDNFCNNQGTKNFFIIEDRFLLIPTGMIEPKFSIEITDYSNSLAIDFDGKTPSLVEPKFSVEISDYLYSLTIGM